MERYELANNLLNDDFFKSVIDELKADQISVIVQSNQSDVDLREIAYNHIKTLDLLVGRLEGIAAQKQINQKRWKIL